MEFSIEKKNNTVFVNIVGPLDENHVRELSQNLQFLLTQEFEKAVFNFSQVLFVTSLALGVFLIFYKDLVSNGRKLQIKGSSDALFHLFRSIKLDTLFPIEK